MTAYVTRRRPPEQQARPAVIGLNVMIAGLALLALAGLASIRWLITPALLVFGAGFGVGLGLGGVVRDMMLALTGSQALAYSSVFILEAIGLAVCLVLALRLDVAGFARQQQGDEYAAAYVLAD